MSMFQSTRPWGARLCTPPRDLTTSVFQSTRPWGARPLWCPSLAQSACFNPRARGGRDEGVQHNYLNLARFQSTRPWGARQYIFNLFECQHHALYNWRTLQILVFPLPYLCPPALNPLSFNSREERWFSCNASPSLIQIISSDSTSKEVSFPILSTL